MYLLRYRIKDNTSFTISYFCIADAGKAALDAEAKKDAIGGIERKSTRAWAVETGYNAEKLFNKVSWVMFVLPGHGFYS